MSEKDTLMDRLKKLWRTRRWLVYGWLLVFAFAVLFLYCRVHDPTPTPTPTPTLTPTASFPDWPITAMPATPTPLPTVPTSILPTVSTSIFPNPTPKWEQAKSIQVHAAVLESDATIERFEIVAASCAAVVPGEEGTCCVTIESLSSLMASVDAVAITSDRQDVQTDVWWCTPWDIEPYGKTYVNWTFVPDNDAPPGDVTFAITVTCSSGPTIGLPWPDVLLIP